MVYGAHEKRHYLPYCQQLNICVIDKNVTWIQIDKFALRKQKQIRKEWDKWDNGWGIDGES